MSPRCLATRSLIALSIATLLAGTAHAQDVPLAPRDQFGQVVVTNKQIGGGTRQFEQVFGGVFDSEPAYRINPLSEVRKLARSVGRLDILFDEGTGYCTAFLISNSHLMTNAHCLSAGTPQAISFTTGYVEFGIEEGTQSFAVNADPLEISPPNDLDYAILEVFGNPAKDWGTLELAAVEMESDTHAGWPLLIIGHPIFQTAPAPVPNSQYVSRKECQATLRNAVAGNRLRHTCDTLPGNSGSPVFGDDNRKVIALHHAADTREGVNFAVPIARIAQDSRIVAALVADQTTPQDPPPGAPRQTALGTCDAALAKAQQSQSCADFDIFLSTCTDHAMLPFVASFAKTLCEASEPAPAPATAPALAPAPETSLTERMAADDDVQRCDSLAGADTHPDREAGLMQSAGIAFADITDAEQAIDACAAAIRNFPDHPRLLAHLGRAFHKAGSHATAATAYRKAAELDDPVAQMNLGALHFDGQVPLQSDAVAVSWYEKAAAQGYAPAQANLGHRYLTGKSVPASDKEAATWFRKAAAQGHAGAQHSLGWMFERGRGVAQSKAQALDWYRKAADQGDEKAAEKADDLSLELYGVTSGD